ncbi:hypothetical protein K525DRAFT_214767 [Schizophyllum commune Loenen D]|nr:hypothetical protein K525DRAFT_214767 [Schizophyllum commune Loenen D]
MHHAALNLPDVLLGLWRGTLDCDRDRGDSMTRWTWAVLRDEMWKAHGKTVADATPYLPGSFDRPPRNPAEKINSGYKAIEYLTYLFVLGPGLLYRILPEPYYSNFCMLVTGLRILHQRSISSSDLVQAHQYLLTFVADYEKIYYQQRTSRFHFVRQSIHSLTHVALEVQRLGPPGLYSQWTMERTIGNLGQEIRQPSNPYMNLSERAVRRAQLNAVRALMPGLASHSQRRAPRNAHNAGGGYSLRSARDETPVDVPQVQARALQDFLRESGLPPSSRTSQRGTLRVMRWARLALPNGQIARSEWKESGRAHGRGMRIARNVKVTRNSRSFIAEVLYYFLHRVEGFEEPLALAMVHRYSPPDTELLNQTHQALAVCTANRHDAYVVRVQEIRMVVGMVPLPTFGRLPEFPTTRFFIAEKLGLELAQLGGVVTGEEEEED